MTCPPLRELCLQLELFKKHNRIWGLQHCHLTLKDTQAPPRVQPRIPEDSTIPQSQGEPGGGPYFNSPLGDGPVDK